MEVSLFEPSSWRAGDDGMTFLWLVAGFLVGDLLGWWLCPAEVLASCNWNSYTMGPSPHCSAHDALSVVWELFVQRIAR